ncbi:heat shock protein HspQ [Candidatus Colwellia aromaticivorans]|uniref:heat shock protein HspQ n=1 Tax=Candidatus Colwellia aromaticivorans TaxID=2267621 RepID=UPI000DF21E22|nr:heat shock protein HspQ [Candidatus Colwellia aromaticivorans]
MPAKFYIGQIIYHNRFNYRGVIVGIDAVFSHSEYWYENMATSRPPKDRPWYHVLVDQSLQSTYVAERNLLVNDDSSQINHHLLGHYFDKYDGKRYYSKQKPH